MGNRVDLLEEMMSEIQEIPPARSVEKDPVKSGRARRNIVRTALGAVLASGALMFPALAALPSASANAVGTKYCSVPKYIKRDHTRYCPNGVSHYTYNYTRTSTYLTDGWKWHTCYHFTYYRWFIGCQETAGPFNTKRCN